MALLIIMFITMSRVGKAWPRVSWKWRVSAATVE
jgi:hypothetical protein